MIDRRTFLELAGVPLIAAPASASAAFPATQPDRALFPCPGDGAVLDVNPAGFAWWRAPGAASYRLVVQDAAGKRIHEASGLKDPVHLPDRTLPPGNYRWDVEALDRVGAVLARRGWWRFRMPASRPELLWEEPAAILARVPDSHPRYIFLKKDLPRLRQSLSTTRKAAWTAVRMEAEKALKVPFPEPPKYHTFAGKDRQRMGYDAYFRDFQKRVDATLSVLSLAWLLSEEERYGLHAKRLLLEVESWGIEGPMSVLSPFGDEPGLSLARHGHRAYDWLYSLFDASERERARNMTAARARQVLARLKKANYLATPAESHDGRLIAYLAEYAVTMKGEEPDVAEWLDYSLKALTTFYPHWADSDGGWAEGISYALVYNTFYLGAIESLRAAAGVDLYRRPFFRNVRQFFLYCTSPIGEMKPFGDGSERGWLGAAGAILLTHHGRRFQDPVSLWWAEQTGEARAVDPLLSLLTEDNLKPAPPSALSSAKVFRGIGWAGLHSALDDPKRDTFLVFKSSPFASVSHSHADQNSFCILKGGRALAIPSGYYGPAYGMPHHAEWTRQTKANNCVLVNGEGQVVRDAAAQGKIAVFRHQNALTGLMGDATAAYGGRLTRFHRYILFLRPGVFVMLDDLAAPEPVQFQWLLHALDRMKVDEAAGTVVCQRKGASLTVRLAAASPLAFQQTDVFDTPFNHGNPPEYHRQVDNQWHFRAGTTVRAAATRMAAVMVVGDETDTFTAEVRQQDGWLGVMVKDAAGYGEVWAQVAPGAKGPLGAGLVTGRWRPANGPEESLEM